MILALSTLLLYILDVNPMRTFRIFDRKLKSPIAENRSQLGFTLIEVMVVIAIIGIMATLIVPQIMSKPDEARVIAAKQDISSLVQAQTVSPRYWSLSHHRTGAFCPCGKTKQ